MLHIAPLLVAAALLPHGGGRLDHFAQPSRACCPVRVEMAAGGMPEVLCRALQEGEAPSDLGDFVATTSGARKLLGEYLTGEQWTCADADEPPAVLVSSLESATPEVGDALLMNVVSGAAASADRKLARASRLVRALWARSPTLRASCLALKDVVASKLGEPESVGWDGNYEYAKDEWMGLLGFAKYERSQLESVRDALEPFEMAPPEASLADVDDTPPWWLASMEGGTKALASCASCGTELRESDKFCPECGTKR